MPKIQDMTPEELRRYKAERQAAYRARRADGTPTLTAEHIDRAVAEAVASLADEAPELFARVVARASAAFTFPPAAALAVSRRLRRMDKRLVTPEAMDRAKAVLEAAAGAASADVPDEVQRMVEAMAR